MDIKQRMLKMANEQLNKEAFWPFDIGKKKREQEEREKRREKEEKQRQQRDKKRTLEYQARPDYELMEAIKNNLPLKAKKAIETIDPTLDHLIYAIRLKFPKIINLLLSKKTIDINQNNVTHDFNQIPLTKAISERNIELTKQFLDYGANVDEISDSEDNNILHFCLTKASLDSSHLNQIIPAILNKSTNPSELIQDKNLAGHSPYTIVERFDSRYSWTNEQILPLLKQYITTPNQEQTTQEQTTLASKTRLKHFKKYH